MTVFKATNISAGFSGQEGFLHDINLEIKTGERVAIMGADHLARGHLLRLLVGMRPQKSGTLEVLGTPTLRLPHFADWDQILPQPVRRRMGVCLEVEGLLNNVSVREGLELLFRFKYGDHTKKLRESAALIVTESCEKFGLESAVEKRPYLLTSAERRLAGLARAFLTKPRVLALENPSANIGDASRAKLLSALDYVFGESYRTVLLSTKDWALAWRYCPRWIILENSRISFDGPAVDFVKSKHRLLDQIAGLVVMRDSFDAMLKEMSA